MYEGLFRMPYLGEAGVASIARRVMGHVCQGPCAPRRG